MRGVRLTFALLAAAVMATDPAWAAPPDFRIMRSESVAGVRIEEIDEMDGGTMVRLARRGRGYRFEYSLEFWRGNGGVVVGAGFRSADCRSGESDSIQPTDEAMTRASLDRRLADYLAECPLGAAREAELRRRLDAAWPTFSAWAQDALDALEAEIQAIVDYGREP